MLTLTCCSDLDSGDLKDINTQGWRPHILELFTRPAEKVLLELGSSSGFKTRERVQRDWEPAFRNQHVDVALSCHDVRTFPHQISVDQGSSSYGIAQKEGAEIQGTWC